MPAGDVDVLAGRADRILLAGVARSGTSWLGRAMASTENTRYYYEPDNVDADPSGERPGGHGFGPYPILRSGRDPGQFQPLWDAVFSGRLPKRRGVGLLAARAALRLPPRIRDPLIRTSSRALTALPGGPDRTVVKTIYALFSLDWLVERYEPRVVVLQRSPLNVVSSWRQLNIPLFDLAQRVDIRREYLEPLSVEPPATGASELARIAWHVGLLTTVLGDAVDKHPSWLLVDHEDLCRDPTRRMHAVFDRAGIPWTPGVERFLEDNDRPGEGLQPVRVTSEQPDRWRGRLSDAEVRETTEVLAQFPRQGWVRMPPAGPGPTTDPTTDPSPDPST